MRPRVETRGNDFLQQVVDLFIIASMRPRVETRGNSLVHSLGNRGMWRFNEAACRDTRKCLLAIAAREQEMSFNEAACRDTRKSDSWRLQETYHTLLQ